MNDGCLHCSCPLTSIWGIPCVHAICVAYSSHRDVSVLWWKAYLKSAIQTTVVEQDHSNTITRMFKKLQEEEKEAVGINVDASWFQKIPIHQENISEEYKSDSNVVKCLNYPNSNDPKCSAFYSNNMDMFGFVQICSQQQDDTNNKEEDSISFPPLESHEESCRKKFAYSQCVAHFKETMDWIGSVGSQEDVDKVRLFLNEMTGTMK